MPLSEFAKRQRGQSAGGHGHKEGHTGHGRRDQLTAGERTRILRMLRDEGGRMADEDSQVFVGQPPTLANDLDDSPAPAPAPALQRPDIAAKPAVVVGLAQANSRRKRPSGIGSVARPQPPSQPQPPPMRAKPATLPPPVPRDGGPRPRREPPRPFDDKTRQVSDQEMLARVRRAPGPGQLFNEPTRIAEEDPRLQFADSDDGLTRPDPFAQVATEQSEPPEHLDDDDEATRMANVDKLAAIAKRGAASPHEERTRAVDIRNDPKMNDIDWDID
jgi:hypothetical protein